MDLINGEVGKKKGCDNMSKEGGGRKDKRKGREERRGRGLEGRNRERKGGRKRRIEES